MSESWSLPEGKVLEESNDKLIGIASDPIGWVVFNDPARRNALSRGMWEAIPAVLAALENDPAIKVIILTGAGGKAFISGADINEFERHTPETDMIEARRRTEGQSGVWFSGCRKPTLAMIEGACIGGGLATALNCDIRIAAEGSLFGIPAARLGVGYPFDGIEKLVSIVGPAQAKQIMFTAEFYQSDRALQMGLVNEVVPREALENRVLELADMMARNAPLTVAAAKIAIDQLIEDPGQRDNHAVDEAIAKAMSSDDVVEGHQAFIEKRPAEFKGR